MGFLSTAATEAEPVKGNFAFKDCWLGLEVRFPSPSDEIRRISIQRISTLTRSFVALFLQWVRDNIHSFGGDASRIDISGLSAGAHVCHQMLLHAARLAPAPVGSRLILKTNPFFESKLTFSRFLSHPGSFQNRLPPIQRHPHQPSRPQRLPHRSVQTPLLSCRPRPRISHRPH